MMVNVDFTTFNNKITSPMIDHTTFKRYEAEGSIWADTTEKQIGSVVTIQQTGLYLLHCHTVRTSGYAWSEGYYYTTKVYKNNSTMLFEVGGMSYPNHSGNMECTDGEMVTAVLNNGDNIRLKGTANKVLYDEHYSYLTITQIA